MPRLGHFDFLRIDADFIQDINRASLMIFRLPQTPLHAAAELSDLMSHARYEIAGH